MGHCQIAVGHDPIADQENVQVDNAGFALRVPARPAQLPLNLPAKPPKADRAAAPLAKHHGVDERRRAGHAIHRRSLEQG